MGEAQQLGIAVVGGALLQDVRPLLGKVLFQLQHRLLQPVHGGVQAADLHAREVVLHALVAGLHFLQDAPELFHGLPQGRVLQQVEQDLLPQADGFPVVRQQAGSKGQGLLCAQAGEKQLAEARQLQVFGGQRDVQASPLFPAGPEQFVTVHMVSPVSF